MEKDISDFCFEAHKPRDIPFAIDSALNHLMVKKKKLKNIKKKCFSSSMD